MSAEPTQTESRTASFERKRHRPSPSDGSSSGALSQNNGAPSKRARLGTTEDFREGHGGLGALGVNSSAPILIDSDVDASGVEESAVGQPDQVKSSEHGAETQRITHVSTSQEAAVKPEEHKILQPSEHTVPQPITWNNGTKAVIRISLGGGGSAARDVPMSNASNDGKSEKNDIGANVLSHRSKQSAPTDVKPEDDAMVMSYSQSQPATTTKDMAQNQDIVADVDANRQELSKVVPVKPEGSVEEINGTLKDIEKENELQTRYFTVHNALLLDDIKTRNKPGSNWISNEDGEGKPGIITCCLVCRESGHLTKACPELKCNICGEANQHFTFACPRNTKCDRCRETGHKTRLCPYKLSRVTLAELICDICGEAGHRERSCAMLWQSFAPDTSSLKKVRQVPMSCYSCGSHEHFGLDCDQRSIDRAAGVTGTTFSMKNASLYVDVNSLHLAISLPPRHHQMGVRSRHQPPEQADVNDDTEFFGPRVPRDDGSRTQIRFTGNGLESGQYSATATSSGAANYQYTGNPPYQTHDQYTPEHFARGSLNHPPQGPHPPQQRGFSLGGQGFARGGGGNSYRPSQRPPPARGGSSSISIRGRGNSGGASVYQPMPSAAKKAWTQHRL